MENSLDYFLNRQEKNSETWTRKQKKNLMLLHKAKHTRDGVDKLYVKSKGGCGLASIDDCNQRRQRVHKTEERKAMNKNKYYITTNRRFNRNIGKIHKIKNN